MEWLGPVGLYDGAWNRILISECRALGQIVGQVGAAVQNGAIQAERDTPAIQTIRLDSSAVSSSKVDYI